MVRIQQEKEKQVMEMGSLVSGECVIIIMIIYWLIYWLDCLIRIFFLDGSYHTAFYEDEDSGQSIHIIYHYSHNIYRDKILCYYYCHKIASTLVSKLCPGLNPVLFEVEEDMKNNESYAMINPSGRYHIFNHYHIICW